MKNGFTNDATEGHGVNSAVSRSATDLVSMSGFVDNAENVVYDSDKMMSGKARDIGLLGNGKNNVQINKKTIQGWGTKGVCLIGSKTLLVNERSKASKEVNNIDVAENVASIVGVSCESDPFCHNKFGFLGDLAKKKEENNELLNNMEKQDCHILFPVASDSLQESFVSRVSVERVNDAVESLMPNEPWMVIT